PYTLLVRRDRFVYAATDARELRTVPRDGSAPPMALAHAEAPLAVDAEHVVWTTRPPPPTDGAYQVSPAYYAGDGWIDDQQGMERGRLPARSADGRHLYFLEHAAPTDGVGELRSYEIATGQVTVLALNVRQFAELDDGRLLAVSNASTVSQWDRVIVIDETQKT